jgi:uncharacterized protein (DUF3820 family)
MTDSLWVVSFGKHKGKPVEDVPDSYLRWLLEREWFCDKFPSQAMVLEKELDYRDRFDLHVGDDQDRAPDNIQF